MTIIIKKIDREVEDDNAYPEIKIGSTIYKYKNI